MSTRPALLRAIIAVLAVTLTGTGFVAAAPAGAQEPEPNGPRSTYIVRFADGVDPAAMSRRGSAEIGAVDEVLTHVFPGVITDLTADQAAALDTDPRVIDVERDSTASTSDLQVNPPWGVDRTDQRDLPLNGLHSYPGTAGNGVNIYVIDTGIRADHREFTGRIRPGIDRVGDGRGTADCNGHGTHVAGTAAGTTYGIAKRASIIPIRVLDCDGRGYISDIISGIDWVVGRNLAGQRGIANLSLGADEVSSALDAATRRLLTDGMAVSIAAGNSSTNACNVSPARISQAVTVGATTSTDRRADFSNHGSCLDLFAPGAGVLSASIGSSTSTAVLDGTSMAAPHVAGAMAVRWGAESGLSGAQVQSRVISAATTGRVTDARSGSPNRLLYSAGPAITAPSNDHFANAASFTTGVAGSTTGTNVAATRQGGEPAHAGSGASRSVWWRFTAAASGSITIDTFGSSFDTRLAVYTGTSVGGLTHVASNDDTGGLQSRVTFSAVSGRTYRVAVDGWSGAQGSIRLSWTRLGPVPWAPFPSAQALVTRQFRDFVGRNPSSSESSTWVSRLTSGSHTGQDLIVALRQSGDNTSVANPTVRLYRAVLRRTPDVGGMSYWLSARRTGGWSLVGMADYFVRSPEFRARYGSLTNRQFVTLIYRDILDRPGDAAGIAYWTDQLNRGLRRRGQVLLGFTESPEYRSASAHEVDATMAYMSMLRRRPTAAEIDAWVRARRSGTAHATLIRNILSSSAYRNIVT